MTEPAVLPCLGHQDLYDALFDDADPEQWEPAHRRAMALCGACPQPCDQQVTATSAPRTVDLLSAGWMPAATEGRSLYTGKERWHGTAAGVATYGCSCARCEHAHEAHLVRHRDRARGQSLRTGASYVPTTDRVDHWAAWAAELADGGTDHAAIAQELLVTEDTVRLLLARRQEHVDA
ncbi:hypothetical protein [Streptomyces sp. t99]|uniref:hypothetical protein n=1 Tax=Streptomyces sp. t99 TaxID=1828172 RepID=UPI000BFB5140|nr:hypothetical protein [Streptomyces sp. t99]